ncbi:MAG: energy transducer TonB [Bdellovibrionales bacterium]|nr:energy transducer TonB [Bdellovibrionales bacterium]
MGAAYQQDNVTPPKKTRDHIPYIPIAISVIAHIWILALIAHLPNSKIDELSQTQDTPIQKVVWKGEEKNQIVDLFENRSLNQKPESSRFSSDRNRKVEKESQARNQSSNPQNRVPENRPMSSNGYKLNLSDQELFSLQKEKDLLASAQSPKNYLPEIAIGEETLLNTQGFAYSNYFVRMKRQIEGHWNPRSYLQRIPYSKNEYVTQIIIILDEKGYVVSTTMAKSSGYSFLDQEALRSIEQAGPFLNPPTELLSQDGQIRIPFSFILLNSFSG